MNLDPLKKQFSPHGAPLHITGIVLAAGKGKRMQSDLPKVLHSVQGRTMLAHVCAALDEIPLDSICLVLGQHLAPFHRFLDEYPQRAVCLQHTANGTGGAVAACAPLFTNAAACSYAPSTLHRGQPHAPSHVLICAGDCPAIDSATLRLFIEESLAKRAKLALLAMKVDDPTGYGRLILDKDQRLRKIVEEKDASPVEKRLQICHSGIMFAETTFLFSLLQQLTPLNEQREYYLTDCIGLAQQAGEEVHYSVCPDYRSCLGVNTPEQLAALEVYMGLKAKHRYPGSH